MTLEDLAARAVRLEARLRNAQIALVVLLLTFGGFVIVQDAGWLPVKGSSLQIADGHAILTVRRLDNSSSLFLYGDSGSDSVSIHAGGPGPSLHLTHSRRGGSVLLSAGKDRALAALSTASTGRRLLLGVGCEGPEISVVEGEDPVRRQPSMPESK